ncbi:MAG: hypothetical protein CR968_00505 [Flavobacteriia bacterium]|nr:MAG: hypothetical protein CR968_00505 [Flavobacteriia bacterium]
MLKTVTIKTALILTIMWLITACSVSKNSSKDTVIQPGQPYFYGFMLYEPATHDTLIDINSKHYFVPASTTKLFTLYTAMQTLGDSLATFNYYKTSDTLYLQPLADPSFLYDSLPNTTLDFLQKTQKPITIIADDFTDFVYGNGWQWDDFQYSYMPEKSLMPVYGNKICITEYNIVPRYFKPLTHRVDSLISRRDFYSNTFYYPSGTDRRVEVPFRTSLELSALLLADTLQRPVNLSIYNDYLLQPYISTPTLPLYKHLMDKSDNFVAEQLMLIVAKQQTGTYKVDRAIEWSLTHLFQDIPQQPRWEDGSGLSRYNLFTPRDMVYILDKFLQTYGMDTVKDIFPSNTRHRALQQWYPYEKTYLYAKTGTLSNNHNICGYILTKSGRVLIFSYMNNNFIQPVEDIRRSVNSQLIKVYNQY